MPPLGGGGGGGPGNDYRHVGEVVRVSLTAAPGSFAPSCAPDAVHTDSATAVVDDPANDEIPNQVTFDAAGPLGPTATVIFTPARPGLFHVTVTFLPVGGRAQLDVFVAADSRDAGATVIPSGCAYAVLRLNGGTVVCDHRVVSGGSAAPFTSDFPEILASNGEGLWTVNISGAVKHFVESDGGLVPDAVSSADQSLGEFTRIVAPGAADLLAITDSKIFRVAPNDGGVTTTELTTHLMRTSGPSAAFRKDPWLYVATEGDLAFGEEEAQACAFDVSATPVTRSCVKVPGSPQAATRDGLWLWEENTGTLRLVQPAPAPNERVLYVAATLQLGQTFVAHRNKSSFGLGHMAFSTRTTFGALPLFVPRLTPSGLILDHYPDLQGNPYPLPSTNDAIWSSDGSTSRVFFVP